MAFKPQVNTEKCGVWLDLQNDAEVTLANMNRDVYLKSLSIYSNAG